MASLEDQYIGHFKIGRRSLPGQLVLAGPQSKLEVFSDKFIHTRDEQMRAIRGVAKSGQKLTICDAMGSSVSGSHYYYGTSKEVLSVFPHYVAVGPRHLETGAVVAEISFTTDGATTLFYDIGAFGSARMKNVGRLMPSWAKRDPRKIEHSNVFYYADRGPIIEVATPQMKITVWNGVSYSAPSPAGINLTNEVRITLGFAKAVTLTAALGAAYDFRAFCEIVSQDKQSPHNFVIRHKLASDQETPLLLHVSHEESVTKPETDFRDNIVSGGLDRQEFQRILTVWLDTQKEMRSARKRIAEGIRQGNHYTIDRLIGAANAFDLLPASKVGKRELPESVLAEIARLSRELNKIEAPYRDQIRGNLNLVKSQNLRTKITARFHVLPNSLRSQLPGMEAVIDHCVRTRNYFVHGSATKLPPEKTYEHLSDFTDALEFLFVSSDLYECGWQPSRWLKQTGHSRFAWFMRNYDRISENVGRPNESRK